MPATSCDTSRRDLLIAMSAFALGALSGRTRGGQSFRIFDALLYSGTRDLGRYGILPLPTLYNLWRPGLSRSAIDYTSLRKALEELPKPTPLFFIDIESWPLLRVDREIRDSSVRKFIEVTKIAREHRPDARLGFYNVPPVGTYWPIIKHDGGEFSDWMLANRALDPLAARVDALFPSLYTFYNERAGWLAVAKGILAEARRYGKPVYPFLWSQFHDSNDRLAGQAVPNDFWAEQLRFCRENADGVVLWGGYQRQWDENAGWWQTTIKTLELKAN